LRLDSKLEFLRHQIMAFVIISFVHLLHCCAQQHEERVSVLLAVPASDVGRTSS
jgi:hypothetical protein